MSAFTKGQAGVAAAEKKKWPEAIELLSQALADTKSPQWLLARAQAYQNTGEPEKALLDVEQAYHAAAQRGNDKSRKQMIEAQYRRAVLLFKKGQYANSDCCCLWAMQLAEGKPVAMADNVSTNVDEDGDYKATLEEARAMKYDNGQGNSIDSVLAARSSGKDPTGYQADWNRAFMWRSQVLAAMEKLPKGDPGRKVTVTRFPAKRTQAEIDDAAGEKAKADAKAAEEERSRAKLAEHAKSETIKKQTLDVAGKFRSQYYQTDKSITVTLLIKFATREESNAVKVQFLPDMVVISGVPRNPPVVYLQLHAPIDPSKSKFRAAVMKVELELVKQEPAKWPNWGEEVLEDPREPGALATSVGNDGDVEAKGSNATTAVSASITEEPKPAPSNPAASPAYPTSSKSGPKNWDKIDDAEEEDDSQDVNFFFKQLYKNSTPEQQRAMMKSYIESNGTALSTDWNNVKDKKVDTVPPNGVEAKKWES